MDRARKAPSSSPGPSVAKHTAKYQNNIDINRNAPSICFRLLVLHSKPHASLPFSSCDTAPEVAGFTGTSSDVEQALDSLLGFDGFDGFLVLS